MPLTDHEWSALSAYAVGEATSDEAERVRALLLTDPSVAQVLRELDDLRTVYRTTYHRNEHRFDASEALSAVRSRLQRADSSSASVRTSSAQKSFTRALAITPVFVLALVGVMLYRSDRSSSTVHQYHTESGQRSTVRLAGGSTMMLAPSTSVSVTAAGIQVTGEAYFTIAPNQARPAVIRTNNAVVQVLGTTFAVRQYPTEAISRVVVEYGKVSVRSTKSASSDGPLAVLSARMAGSVTDSSVTVRPDIALSEYIGWTRGELDFDGASLRDVAAELSRAYGADVRVADSTLAGQSMTLHVSVATESLPKILAFISLAANAHYSRVGSAFVLAPGRMATQAAPLKRFPQSENQYGR